LLIALCPAMTFRSLKAIPIWLKVLNFIKLKCNMAYSRCWDFVFYFFRL